MVYPALIGLVVDKKDEASDLLSLVWISVYDYLHCIDTDKWA